MSNSGAPVSPRRPTSASSLRYGWGRRPCEWQLSFLCGNLKSGRGWPHFTRARQLLVFAHSLPSQHSPRTTMSLKRQPTQGNGFIYILSNPSMPNVYKVGLTTGSISQRIQELNTTGVPKPFQTERLFEIPESKLLAVERLAHRKLKNKDLHHGKEFFEGALHDCVIAVQDAIYEITRSEAADLVGEAKKRAQSEQRRIEQAQARLEVERKRQLELEERVKDTNRLIDLRRERYVSELAQQTEPSNWSFVDKFIWIPIGSIFLGAIVLAFTLSGGLLTWIGVPLFAWWLFNKDRNDTLERRKRIAADKFPYVTSSTINSIDIERILK